MIELRNISKEYKNKRNQKQALNDVSLSFNDVGMYFIVGESGSGKTTLLSLLGGLDVPTSGNIYFDGNDINTLSKDAYRSYNIGYIFQDYNLLPDLNVYDNVVIALELQGKKATKDEVINVLHEVSLDDVIDKKINECSGGEKQRIAIARAIIKNPNIILADEPTGNLDSKNAHNIFQILKKLSEKYLVIIVSHNYELALEYADEIIEINHGTINKIDKLNDIKTIDQNKKIDNPKKKGSLPFHVATRLGLSYLKTNVFKLILSLILSTVAFTCFGTAYSMNKVNRNELMAEYYKSTDYRETMMIGKTKYDWDSGEPMSNQYCEDLNNKFGNHFLPIYNGVYNQKLINYNAVMGDKDIIYDENEIIMKTSSGFGIYDEQFMKDNNFKLYGSLPTDKYDIVITKYHYDSFLKCGYKYNDIIIEKGNITMDALLNKKIDVHFNTGTIIDGIVQYLYHECRIVGILDTNFDEAYYENLAKINELEFKRQYGALDNSFHTLYYTNYDTLNDEFRFASYPEGYVKKIYCSLPKDKLKCQEILDYVSSIELEGEYRLQAFGGYDDWIGIVEDMTLVFAKVTSVIGGVLLLFSVLLLFNFVYIIISHKKNEIGILRSLGAKRLDIFKIFSTQGLFISVINIILTTLIVPIALLFINNYIKKETTAPVMVYNFSFLTFLIIVAATLAATGLSILFPILKSSRLTPKDAIYK